MTKREIEKLSDQEIDHLFSELIRKKMSNDDFEEWLITWVDTETICDQAEEWDIESKKQTLIDYQKQYNN